MDDASGKEGIMNESSSQAAILQAQIRSGLDVMQKIQDHIDGFLSEDVQKMGRTTVSAVIISDGLSRFYTAIETIFVRVARFFENSLEGERWHADLLDRMAFEIPGIRPRVISGKTQADLKELMKSRHFSRYYVELEYDWDRLDFLLLKYHAVKLAIRAEIEEFEKRLGSL
jgi:hypothetical protein